MRDDERLDTLEFVDEADRAMDALLREAIAADVPVLPEAFDARVMQAVRPRRLSNAGRLVMAGYSVAAIGLAAWLMREIPAPVIGLALGASAIAAVAGSAYARRILASS